MLTSFIHPAHINIAQWHIFGGNVSHRSTHEGMSLWEKANACSLVPCLN